MTLDPFTFIVDLLCVYRLSRVLVKDTLLQEIRWWILRRWPSELTTFPASIVVNQATSQKITIGELSDTGVGVYLDEDGEWRPIDTHKFTEYLDCVYCASVPLAFGVLALRVWWDWWQYPALALALAGGVALIFSRLDTE